MLMAFKLSQIYGFSGIHVLYVVSICAILTQFFVFLAQIFAAAVRMLIDSSFMQILGTLATFVGVAPAVSLIVKRVNAIYRQKGLSVDRNNMHNSDTRFELIPSEHSQSSNGCRVFGRQDVTQGLSVLNQMYGPGNLPSDMYTIDGNSSRFLVQLRNEHPRWMNVNFHVIERLPDSRKLREAYNDQAFLLTQLRKIFTPWKKAVLVRVDADRATFFYKLPVVKGGTVSSCLLFDDINRGGKTMRMILHELQKMKISRQKMNYVSFTGGPIIGNHVYLQPDHQIFTSFDGDSHFPWEGDTH